MVLLQVVGIRDLVHAVKNGTLEELITEMLIWLSTEEVVKMDDGSQLLNSLEVAVFKILVGKLLLLIYFVCWKPICLCLHILGGECGQIVHVCNSK